MSPPITGQSRCCSYSPPIWSGDELETAARIISTPRVLLERDDEENDASHGHAQLVERSLFTQGFDHAEIIPFGVKGIATGYASWSGVVYCPFAPRRALTQEELVTTELATQAMWTYCEHINGQVEQGEDPCVPDKYGWRLLRGVRSRLTNARPRRLPSIVLCDQPYWKQAVSWAILLRLSTFFAKAKGRSHG